MAVTGKQTNRIPFSSSCPLEGLKLEELAEQTGISKSALGSYEKEDYKEINHGNLIMLADF